MRFKDAPQGAWVTRRALLGFAVILLVAGIAAGAAIGAGWASAERTLPGAASASTSPKPSSTQGQVGGGPAPSALCSQPAGAATVNGVRVELRGDALGCLWFDRTGGGQSKSYRLDFARGWTAITASVSAGIRADGLARSSYAGCPEITIDGPFAGNVDLLDGALRMVATEGSDRVADAVLNLQRNDCHNASLTITRYLGSVATSAPPTQVPQCPTEAETSRITGIRVQRVQGEACAFNAHPYALTANAAQATCPSGPWICSFALNATTGVVLVGNAQQKNITDGTWRYVPAYPEWDNPHDPCRQLAAENAYLSTHSSGTFRFVGEGFPC